MVNHKLPKRYKRLLPLPITIMIILTMGLPMASAGVLKDIYSNIKVSVIGNVEAIQVKKGNSQTLEALKPLPAKEDKIDSRLLAINDADAISMKPVSIDDSEDDGGIQDQTIIYEVKKGDTIGGVANMFSVSKDTIRWANNLKTDVFKPSQVIMILPITGVMHEVKKSDTIESIAKKYKADVDEVYRYNGLNEKSTLALGDVIIIPDGKKEVDTAATPKKPKVKKNKGNSRLIESYKNEIAGYFQRPMVGGVKTQGLHGHNGIDIGGPVGTPILASASGVVTVARDSGYNGGYGKMIIIKHDNGTQTVYGHLSAVYINEGDSVNAGATIGALGNTGRSTGPHLHFEIRGAANPF